MIHRIKIKEEYWQHKREGKKNFEVRLNDRDYQVGDLLEYDITSKDHNVFLSTKICPKDEIIYVHHGIGMINDYVVLGVREVKQ